MHQDHRMMAWQNNVRSPRKRSDIEPKAESHLMKKATNTLFRASVPSSNLAHVPASALRSEKVGHGLNLRRDRIRPRAEQKICCPSDGAAIIGGLPPVLSCHERRGEPKYGRDHFATFGFVSGTRSTRFDSWRAYDQQPRRWPFGTSEKCL